MRTIDILSASSLVGLAVAISFPQEEVKARLPGQGPPTAEGHSTASMPLSMRHSKLLTNSGDGMLSPPFVQRGLVAGFEGKLHKRGIIKHPVDYMKKASTQTESTPEWAHSMRKFEGARSRDPAASRAVIDSFQARIDDAKDRIKMREVDRSTKEKLKIKVPKWEEKIPDWEQRERQLEANKATEKARGGEHWWKDEEMERKIAKYERKQGLQKRSPVIEASATKKQGQSVIRDILHYVEKADSRRPLGKVNDNLRKAAGVRYNRPKESQDVINNYATKIDLAKEGNVGSLDKVVEWEDKKLLWTQRKAMLEAHKEAGTPLPLLDAEREAKLKAFERQRYGLT